MKYRLPVTIARLGKDAYMARCDVVRATATADTPEEAIKCLREAIDDPGARTVVRAAWSRAVPTLDG